MKTLLNRANLLSSCPELRTNGQEQVLTNLKANGYPDRLLKRCLNNKTKPRQLQERPLGFAALPYIKGASDRVGHVLQKFGQLLDRLGQRKFSTKKKVQCKKTSSKCLLMIATLVAVFLVT